MMSCIVRLLISCLVIFAQVNGFVLTSQTYKHWTSFSSSTYCLKKPLVKRNGLHNDIPFKNPDHDLLVRVARGEVGERTPVWLMRQAGRYMSSFRKYSDVVPFRERCETPEIAVDLSLQCWKAFGMDGVIMFSDILTPLTAMGIDFDVIKLKGPIIYNPIRNEQQVQDMKIVEDYDRSLPFIKDILTSLRKETEGRTTLIGFVGSPLTLASYVINGKATKDCLDAKRMMYNDEALVKDLLHKLSVNIANYACHQISCGAQVIQFFDSWAHHFTPMLFQKFAKVYANKAMQMVKEKHPEVPIIYFANGGSSYLELQRDMRCDVIGLDQGVSMTQAKQTLLPSFPSSSDRIVYDSSHVLAGNVDPVVLFASEDRIRQEVRDTIRAAGGAGRHILNLGHGVIQNTPERSVAVFVDEAKKFV